MDEETKKKIENLLVGVGAIAELLGFMRNQLMQNDFTREEAVGMWHRNAFANVT